MSTSKSNFGAVMFVGFLNGQRVFWEFKEILEGRRNFGGARRKTRY